MSTRRRRRIGGMRYAAVCAAAAALVVLSCTEPVARTEIADRVAALDTPNIVLIVIDTLRADWMSAYGFHQETTPEIKRWAAKGVLFERNLAQSSWTKMSMASMLTSLWPQSHAIRKYGDGLGTAAVTLAEALQDAGYETYAVQTNGWLHQTFGFHQGFQHYVFPTGRAAPKIPKATVWAHADRVLEETTRLLDHRPTDRPFFLYVHFMDVHEYAAPNEFKTFGTDGPGAYRGAIRWLDDAVSRVRGELDRVGVLEETVILLTSDHGEAFGENGKSGHALNVLTAVLHVPLVIRFPFETEPVRIPTQVRNLDVAPTLLDIAGVPIPTSFEGESLLPLITASGPDLATAPDRISYADLGLPLFPDASIQTSVNTGSWTLARNLDPDPQPGQQLYDRTIDPGENVDLVEREPDEARRLAAILDAYLARESVPGVLAEEVRIAPEIANKLRALGYME
jgi:arylsulfatase A-like enzyme